MRIPSQLDRDNLYRRENRSRSGGGEALRKLVRLAVALALVVVVMRQAGRPEIYELFFADTGSPPAAGNDRRDGRPQTPGSSGAPSGVEIEPPDGAAAPTPEMQQTASELVARLSDQQRRAATAALAALDRSAEPSGGMESDSAGETNGADESGGADESSGADDSSGVNESSGTGNADDSVVSPIGQALAAALSEASKEVLRDASQRQRWDRSVRRVVEGSELTGEDRQRLAALDAALESAALARVADGSTWRAEDTDAFYLYLRRAPHWSASDAPLTGVLPLLQQPDIYRGSLLRVSGRVARAERVSVADQAAADFDIDEYWQLWLRPDDGTARPILAVVPAVSEPIRSLESESIIEQGPQVTVLGKFLKRLAYRSAAGADLAPVVVGRLGGAAFEAEQATDGSPQPVERESTAPLMWILIIALLIGVGLSAVAMWQTSRVTRRLREIRRSRRQEPSEFFQQLADSPSAVDRPHETDREQ